MCGFPPALFDSPVLLKQANKPALAEEIWAETKEHQTDLPKEGVHYVVDGGALLHRVPWPRGATYESIARLYVEYVCRKYGTATVVFDGYADGPSTKDCTHQRRTSGHAPTINFDASMVCRRNFLLTQIINKGL